MLRTMAGWTVFLRTPLRSGRTRTKLYRSIEVPAPNGSDGSTELTEPETTLETDLLYGAKAIAKALGCRPRRIYYLAERGRLPIWNEPGIGLMARRSSLETYFKNREQQALERERR